MTKFNLKLFMECDHVWAGLFRKTSLRGVEIRQMCTKCGMDRRIEGEVIKLKEVEDGRKKRNNCSE